MIRRHSPVAVLLVAVFGILLTMVSTSSLQAAPDQTAVTELAPGVFFRKAQTEPTFTGCNQGWVIFKDYVLLIDANFPGQAEEVLKAIRATTDKPIRFVFDTHYHGDHADGNPQYVKLGATIVAHERSQPLFQTKGLEAFTKNQQDADKKLEYGSLSYAIPSLYFSHKLIFDDGQQRVELLFLGHAHTAGDAVAWLPKHQILFTGDACVNGAFNYTGDSNTESWASVLGAMQELEPKQIAPGHGELGGPDLVATQQRYFLELRSAVRQGIDSAKTLDQIKESIDLPFYKEWTGVEVKTRVENIEHVYRELTAGKEPISRYRPLADWIAAATANDAGENAAGGVWEEIGTSGPDRRWSQLADIYLAADSNRRKQIRDYFAQRPQDLDAMWLYVRRMGRRVATPEDTEWVRRALAVAAIEGGRSNYRDTIVSLVLLRYGAERAEIQIDRLFQEIQAPEYVAPENKPLFENVRTHSPRDIAATVAAFGPADWVESLPADTSEGDE